MNVYIYIYTSWRSFQDKVKQFINIKGYCYSKHLFFYQHICVPYRSRIGAYVRINNIFVYVIQIFAHRISDIIKTLVLLYRRLLTHRTICFDLSHLVWITGVRVVLLRLTYTTMYIHRYICACVCVPVSIPQNMNTYYINAAYVHTNDKIPRYHFSIASNHLKMWLS